MNPPVIQTYERMIVKREYERMIVKIIDAMIRDSDPERRDQWENGYVDGLTTAKEIVKDVFDT